MPVQNTKKWIDISVGIVSGMVHWPGDPAVNISFSKDMAKGDSCTLSHLSMGSHSGTHMDAPRHFISGGAGIDKVSLDVVTGPARVIEIKNRKVITIEELTLHRIRRGERILFKTLNSRRCWKTNSFIEDFVYIPGDTASYLAKKGVVLVGVDYLSCGGYKKDGRDTHRVLLGAGTSVVEGLNLSKVSPGIYDFVCLPLKISGMDGAPARAILRMLSLT